MYLTRAKQNWHSGLKLFAYMKDPNKVTLSAQWNFAMPSIRLKKCRSPTKLEFKDNINLAGKIGVVPAQVQPIIDAANHTDLIQNDAACEIVVTNFKQIKSYPILTLWLPSAGEPARKVHEKWCRQLGARIEWYMKNGAVSRGPG